jgi:cell division protein YceG involved in septum cleavage
MKKVFLNTAIFCLLALAASAQPGGFQRMSVVERIKLAEDKLDSAFKLAPEKKVIADSAISTFYLSMDARRQQMQSGENNQQQWGTMMEEMKKLTEARDEKLKTALTDEQFKIWKEKIEPSLRGGGGQNRQNRFGGNGFGGRRKNDQ